MTWRQVRGHNLIGKSNRFAVMDDLVWGDGRKRNGVAEAKVAATAAAQEFGVPFTGDEIRAGPFFELSQTAGMIVMGVTIQEDLHVAQFETELLDVSGDLGRGFDKATVEQKMTLCRRDQVGSDFIGPDIIEIPGYPKRRHRFIPAPVPFAGLGENPVEREENGGCGDHDL
jgi:hypothetical protein